MMSMSRIVSRFEVNPEAFPEDLQEKLYRYQRFQSNNRVDEHRLDGLKKRISDRDRKARDRVESLKTKLAAALAGASSEIASLRVAAESSGTVSARRKWARLNAEFEEMTGGA